MSNNLWNRVANFFKEWDGEDMTKSMHLSVDELREVNSNRIELIRLEREHKEIRDKAIEKMKELVEGHKYVNAEDGTTIEEMLKNEETEKKYAWYLSRNQCCDWMLHRLDEIAEKMREVGE